MRKTAIKHEEKKEVLKGLVQKGERKGSFTGEKDTVYTKSGHEYGLPIFLGGGGRRCQRRKVPQEMEGNRDTP